MLRGATEIPKANIAFRVIKQPTSAHFHVSLGSQTARMHHLNLRVSVFLRPDAWGAAAFLLPTQRKCVWLRKCAMPQVGAGETWGNPKMEPYWSMHYNLWFCWLNIDPYPSAGTIRHNF